VIVGAGVAGLSLACSLARRNAGLITLIDQVDKIGSLEQASSVNCGIVVSPVYPGDSYLDNELYRISQKVSEDLGDTIKYEKSGSLYPCLTADSVEWAKDFVKEYHESFAPGTGEKKDGDAAIYLERADALLREPLFGPEVLGALYCPGDGHINPKKMIRELER